VLEYEESSARRVQGGVTSLLERRAAIKELAELELRSSRLIQGGITLTLTLIEGLVGCCKDGYSGSRGGSSVVNS